MPELPPLVARVVGDISGFRSSMAEARGEMDATSSKGGGFVSNLKSQLGGVGLAAGALGVTFAKFAFDSAEAFAKTTAEVRAFQRVSGASAEDSSKLVAASKELGISSDAAANAFFRLGRNVATHSDALKADGIQIAVNKQGNTDLVGTLFNVADAYNRTSDQAQKNKIVMDAFGRTGAQLIPILQRGRDGLKDLFAEAEKHHQVFDDAELQKGKEFSLAMAGLHQTFEGLQTEVGSAVIPTFTDFAHMLTTVTEKIDSLNSIAGGKGGGFLGKLAETIAQNVDPALLLLGGHTDDTKKQIQDLTEAETKAQLASGLYTSSQQDAARSALDRMVGNGRLTQSQLDQNVAMHLAKDGSLDYAATLKELDATEAKQIDLQARFDAGLGDVRYGYERAADAANVFKNAVDNSLGTLLSAQDADHKLAQSKDRLSEALSRNTATAEEAKQKSYDVKQATIDLIQATEQDIDAKVRDSNGTISATDAKSRLIAQLQQEQAQYPALRGEIQGYIDRINSIPPEQLFTAVADVGGAISNIDQLRAHIAALRAESNQPIVNVGGGQVGVQAHGARLMAAGGFVRHQPGGVPAILAEAGGDEVVVPLDDPRRAMELARQSGLLSMLSGASGGGVAPMSVGPASVVAAGTTIVIVNLDGREVTRVLAPSVRASLQSGGRNNVNVGLS